MCFSLTASIVSFMSAIISGLIAIYYKHYIFGMLILCYGQVQLSELIIWLSIHKDDINLNEIGTNYGKYLLPAHNIAIGLGIYMHTKNMLPLIIGLIFYISILVVYYFTTRNTITKPGCIENQNCYKYAGKLQWPYEHRWYLISFIISLFLFFYYIKPFYPVSLFISSFFIITWTVIWILNKNDAYGSYWCYTSAMLTPIIVLINILLTSKYSNVIS